MTNSKLSHGVREGRAKSGAPLNFVRTHMSIIKRFAWLFLSGFVVVGGALAALVVAGVSYEKYHMRETALDPRDYQSPAPGEVTFSGIEYIEITGKAGIHGNISNNTKRNISSLNVNVSFIRKGVFLYLCNETVLVDIAPSANSHFQLICDKVDRKAVTSDIEPKLSVVWVYPSQDK